MSKSRISRDIKTLFYFSVTCYKKRVMKKSNNDFNFRNQSNRSLFIAGGGRILLYYTIEPQGGNFIVTEPKFSGSPPSLPHSPPLSGINVDRCLNDNERGSVSL